MAIRSMPIPNANPVYIVGSMLQFFKTLGSTIPQPRISSHPVPLQTGQPLPPHIEHEISISAEGSVKGKYEGRKRICVSFPNISLAKYNNVCFKSANETLVSTYKPST